MSSTSGKKFFVRDATGLTRALTARDAMIGNMVGMGIGYLFVYGFWSELLFPGVNLPITALFAAVPGVIISFVYYLLTVSMPRTGGDFVWVGRVMHPALGFLTNFAVTFSVISYMSTDAIWTVTYGLSPMFAALGVINPNSTLTSLASTLTEPFPSFVLGCILVIAFTLPLFFGTKTTFRVLWILFGTAILGTLVLIGAFYATPSATFVANFNQLSGMDYLKTISTAGLSPGFTLAMTLTGSIYTVSTYIGFNFSAYYTGEVKQVSRSQIIAMIGSVLIFTVFTFLIYGSAYSSAGADFLAAISALGGTGNSYYSLPTAPILNFLVVFAVPNPLVVVLANLGLIVSSVGSITAFSFVVVRNIFAWSFDRIMPSWFANVDSRRNSPYVAVLVTLILDLLMTYLYVYTVFFSFLVYILINFFIVFAIVSITAMAFPIRRKDLFASSPDIVKKKIGQVPLISLLGVAGLVISIFLTYSTLQPAVTAPPSGSTLVQAISYAFVPLTMVLSLIIYAFAAAYRKRQGMDMGIAFRELPPE